MPNVVRIADRFDVNHTRILGEGGFGKVYRAKDTADDPPSECAAKQMKLSADTSAALEREVGIMRDLKHVSVIGFSHYEVVDNHAWIFMELATGGELFDRLIDSGNLTERAVYPYFLGIVQGLLHCLQMGIVHRDIKLENVMLCAEDPHAVKLVDFGLAVRMGRNADGSFDNMLFYDRVGSKSYRSPEILLSQGYTGPPVDVWALGITIFSLVSGFFPLDEARSTDWRYARLEQECRSGLGPCDSIYGMYRRQCPFTKELKELLNAMLAIDPNKRITMQQISAHPWFAMIVRKPGAGGMMMDEDGEEVMYRSAAGGGDDEDATPFEMPELAMKIVRQRADVLGDDALA